MATNPTLNAEEEEEKLNIFLMGMHDVLEAFVAKAARGGYQLSYSVDCLDDLERYIREQRMDWRDKSDVAVNQRLDCWALLGTIFQRHYGGHWAVSLDDPDSVNYGQFVIQGFDAVGMEFEPLGVLQGFLLRGKPGGLRRVMEAHVNLVPLDLSHLPEDEE